MNKQELIRDMKQSNNGAGLINIKGISSYTGLHRNSVRRLMANVAPLLDGRYKRYAVRDVAEAIVNQR